MEKYTQLQMKINLGQLQPGIQLDQSNCLQLETQYKILQDKYQVLL